jgi:hypothetical protein
VYLYKYVYNSEISIIFNADVSGIVIVLVALSVIGPYITAFVEAGIVILSFKLEGLPTKLVITPALTPRVPVT